MIPFREKLFQFWLMVLSEKTFYIKILLDFTQKDVADDIFSKMGMEKIRKTTNVEERLLQTGRWYVKWILATNRESGLHQDILEFKCNTDSLHDAHSVLREF